VEEKTPMAFVIEEAVWEAFPGMVLVVASGKGLDNQMECPAVQQLLQEAQERLKSDWRFENAQSHPHVAAWRKGMQKVGVSGKQFPSSIEALCRRVLSGKAVARINPLVDFYNAVSLQEIVPVGAWDVDDITGEDILLKRTVGGEPFKALGEQEVVHAGPGEVSYADAAELITRHFVWRQSERGKINPGTRQFFLVSEILPEVGPEVAARVEETCANGLREYLGLEPKTAILPWRTPRWDWD
jgi:DNA/RNA-binding domain of Phe-tRNA-synthetase-like protein